MSGLGLASLLRSPDFRVRVVTLADFIPEEASPPSAGDWRETL